jgi:hypothetical protein
MVKVIGKLVDEVGYRVLAKGFTFEVTVCGKVFRIKHVGGGNKLPLNHVGTAFDEVRKFLEVRGAAACMALIAFAFN